MIPTHIIVHCSDSEWGSAGEIRRWHQQQGWIDIGYHFVILNGSIDPLCKMQSLNGSIEVGRAITRSGAHCIGFNDHSIGICGVAKAKWTDSQVVSLVILCRELVRKYKIPIENILGHYETTSGKSAGKTCPNLDMDEIRDQIEGEKK